MKKKITKESRNARYPIGLTADKQKISVFLKSLQAKKSEIYIATAKTGARFIGRPVKASFTYPKGEKGDISRYEQVNVSPCDKGYFMTFVQKGQANDRLMAALSKDLKGFRVTGKISKARNRGALVPNYKCDGKYFMYLGEESIRTASSRDLSRWNISDVSCLAPRSDFFDHTPLSVIAVSMVSHGILVIYDASHRKNGWHVLQIGAALFSLSDPEDLIWRSERPIWEETRSAGSEEIHPAGAVFEKDNVLLYFASKKGRLLTVVIPQPFPSIQGKKVFARLKRFYKNPIIVPSAVNEWEADGAFNPAALYDNGKVHLLYRAVSKGGLSSFGYASTKDGFHIDERLPEPAYVPREEFEGVHTKPSQRTDLYKSGCGWGGCEDPKLTSIDNKIYLTYVAFNGYAHPRIALSSLAREDFLNKKWNWEESKLISEPGVVNKSGCILPEKIKGKYVIFHRIFPHILIDYRDDLEFSEGNDRWLKTNARIHTRPRMWDSRKISVGATPIKTEDGWLVIYHAVDDRDDSRYKVGAMILDAEDPSKVLFRTTNPILEPEEHYENEGKFGVVYPCGAVVLGKELFVYYGGGDRVSCCATVELSKFLKDIKRDKEVSFALREVVYS